MITKEQFCKLKIQEFCEEEGITLEQLNENMIYKSSTLAVCMDYLGMIEKKDNREYAEHRDGIVCQYEEFELKRASILSVRELISLLPETT